MKLKRKVACKHFRSRQRPSVLRVVSGTRAGLTVYGPPYYQCRKCGRSFAR